MKARYKQGSITWVARESGHAWRVRFSEWQGMKRKQMSLTFSGEDYPNESGVRKAIELSVLQQNRETERVKVDALFGVIGAHYKADHLPGLEPSTGQTAS